MFNRRAFLKNGALSLVGTAAIPGFLARAISVQPSGLSSSKKKLVVIFQRGAADGLNIVVPYGESNYYAARPTLAIPKEQVLDLNGFFGLHPSLQPLKPLWDQKRLAIVHAAGSPDTTRSHFDAQDYMESGTPGLKTTPDGWLNRVLQAEDLGRKGQISSSAFRAVALGSQLPRSLQGKVPALSIGNLQNFSVGGRNPNQNFVDNLQSMYVESRDVALRGTGQETFEAVKVMRSLDPAHYKPAASANYPKSAFGSSMKQIAQLLKADVGVEAAFADIGDWDTHQNQGAGNGRLAGRLKDFSEGIAAFWNDMGDQAEDVVLVTMSEFGRTVAQNGTGGTDHGHGNVMFVLGGPIAGGAIYGDWPGLAPEQLYEKRDLAVTTDYRRVLGEVIRKHMGVTALNTVFPDAQLRPESFLNLQKT